MNENPIPPPLDTPPPTENFESDSIGGWLVLPMLGLILSPFALASSIMDGCKSLQTAEIASAEEAFPGIKAVLISEVAFEGLILVFGLYVAVMFFRKKASVPLLMTILMAAPLVFMLVDLGALYVVTHGTVPIVDADSIPEIARALLVPAIWIPYFLMSKRVKSTFWRP